MHFVILLPKLQMNVLNCKLSLAYSHGTVLASKALSLHAGLLGAASEISVKINFSVTG